MSDTVIKVENLSKEYFIGKSASMSFREAFAEKFSSKKKIQETSFFALKDISFEIKQGDAVGIIGKNGAGKSTLLKILSRITKPSKGRIEINGRVASLLEVGTGFHPELTGRENIFLNGTILGMSRAEVKSKFDEIVAFSGVEKFIDTPVKRYSSGMYVRLAFAVAAHLEPEILIIDEVLAVGDAEFQKKCLGKMDEVSKDGRTVLFVSHNMAALQQICSFGILLKQGSIVVKDKIDKVSTYYLNEGKSSNINLNAIKRRGNGEVKFTNFSVVDNTGVIVNEILSNQELMFKFTIATKERLLINDKLDIGFSLHDELDNTLAICYSSYFDKTYKMSSDSNELECVFTFNKFSFCLPSVFIRARIVLNGVETDFTEDYLSKIDVIPFNVYASNVTPSVLGKVVLNGFWN